MNAFWIAVDRRGQARQPARAACEDTGGSEQLSIELLFGRSMPGGQVSEPAFQDFLAGVVTPRFPDGLTVLDGYGQWRTSTGTPSS